MDAETPVPTLVESIAGCADCAAEAAYQLSIGHVCDASSSKWTTFCEVIHQTRLSDPEFHRLSHLPTRCESCGQVTDDRRGDVHLGLRKCASGQCDEWFCQHCGATNGSSGPLDCPTCGSLADGDVDA